MLHVQLKYSVLQPDMHAKHFLFSQCKQGRESTKKNKKKALVFLLLLAMRMGELLDHTPESSSLSLVFACSLHLPNG